MAAKRADASPKPACRMQGESGAVEQTEANMKTTQVQRFAEDPESMRGLQQELVILEVTSRICQLMEDQGVTRSELARRLGTTKGYITQLLDGRANMTLRKLADVFTALDHAVKVGSDPLANTLHP